MLKQFPPKPTANRSAPLQFHYPPYPLWRRELPFFLQFALAPLWRAIYPVEADQRPPASPEAMSEFLQRWQVMPGMPQSMLTRALYNSRAVIETASTDDKPPAWSSKPVRVPAQWEPMETVLLRWPVLHPPLWPQFAHMAEAISSVCNLTVIVPAPMWGHVIWVYLLLRENTQMENIRFLRLPTNDMWVRDYGPIVGLDAQGKRVAVDCIFDPLPAYDKTQDNAMPRGWAAHTQTPLRALDLHFEGGNLWSDGAGTLIISEQVFYSNPYLSRAALEAHLHDVFDYQKLIVTPRLDYEETGHVDLLVKLADAQTVLVTRPGGFFNRGNLRAAADLFRRQTNAQGESYTVVELPNLPPYLNWGLWPVWRSYTNSLTVNGRVLVPVYGVPEDAEALATYQRAMPGFEIIPIDSQVAINGGGTVHCLTKEIPKAQR